MMKFPNVRIDKREKMIATMFKRTNFIHVLEKNDGGYQYISDGRVALKMYDRHDVANTKQYDEGEFEAIKGVFSDEDQEEFCKVDVEMFENAYIDVDRMHSHNADLVKRICKIVGGEVEFCYVKMPGSSGFKILKIVGVNGVGVVCPVRT